MDTARFWREFPSRYNLRGSKCGNCNTHFFPPRIICPACHRKSFGKMERVKITDNARVISYTTVHDGPEHFSMLVPYVLAIVEFPTGVRATGQIVDCKPDEVAVGMEVAPTFRKIGEDGPGGVIHYGYKFKPVVKNGSDAPPED